MMLDVSNSKVSDQEFNAVTRPIDGNDALVVQISKTHKPKLERTTE
jgi:hypothetical protein